jgi:hypothetical protein
MKNTFIIFIISTLSFSSCKKIDFDKTNLDKPTVDGIVYAGRKPKIHLSLPIGYGNDATSQTNIDNAQVIMTISGVKYALASKGNGDYVNDKVILKAGQELELMIVYEGNTLTSSTVVPTKPKNLKASESQIQITVPTGGGGPFGGGGFNQASAALTWDNDIQEYYVLLTKNIEKWYGIEYNLYTNINDSYFKINYEKIFNKLSKMIELPKYNNYICNLKLN